MKADTTSKKAAVNDRLAPSRVHDQTFSRLVTWGLNMRIAIGQVHHRHLHTQTVTGLLALIEL